MLSYISKGIFCDTVSWCLILFLLLKVTVTLGGEEVVSISPRSQSSKSLNITNHSLVQQKLSSSILSTPLPLSSSPVILDTSTNRNRDLDEDTDSYEEQQQEEEETGLLSSTGRPIQLSLSDIEQPGLNSFTTISSIVQSNTTAIPTKKKTNRKQFCSKTYAYLDKCLAHIPPIPDTGIPSTPMAVESACRTFNMGMACVDEWTSKCLKKDKIAKFKQSISGAHETFTFLCRDHKFRQEFLKHGDCYKRISHKWDECSRNFITLMKRFHTENSTIQCCVRLSFLQCVSEISHYHCKKDAAQFLAKMAETLVRATMRNHVPPMCVSIHQRNCSILSSAPSIYVPHTIQTTTTTFFIIYIFSAILQSILKY